MRFEKRFSWSPATGNHTTGVTIKNKKRAGLQCMVDTTKERIDELERKPEDLTQETTQRWRTQRQEGATESL